MLKSSHFRVFKVVKLGFILEGFLTLNDIDATVTGMFVTQYALWVSVAVTKETGIKASAANVLTCTSATGNLSWTPSKMHVVDLSPEAPSLYFLGEARYV